MPNKPLSHLPIVLMNDFFRLHISQQSQKTQMRMTMFSKIVSTKSISKTSKLLSQNLPGIYTHKCFNYLNVPFGEEVKKTEIGHLFEHILLEHLSELKKAPSSSNFILEGKTQWDWQTDKVGVFHIDINIGIEDEVILYQALERSINLIKQILKSKSSSLKPLSLVTTS